MFIFSVIQVALYYLLNLMLLLLTLRAVFSWVSFGPKGNPFYTFFCVLTEPLVAPTRKLLDRFPQYQSLPIDMSVFLTMLVLGMIQRFILML